MPRCNLCRRVFLDLGLFFFSAEVSSEVLLYDVGVWMQIPPYVYFGRDRQSDRQMCPAPEICAVASKVGIPIHSNTETDFGGVRRGGPSRILGSWTLSLHFLLLFFWTFCGVRAENSKVKTQNNTITQNVKSANVGTNAPPAPRNIKSPSP